MAPELAKKLASDPQDVQAAKDRVAAIGSHIQRNPQLRAINSKFGPLKKRLRGREPAWYRVGGPSSISQMAQRLGAQSVFYDEQALLLEDPRPLHEEDRFILLGLSSALRLLVVVHALRDRDIIRIISARKATRLETREYEMRLR